MDEAAAAAARGEDVSTARPPLADGGGNSNDDVAADDAEEACGNGDSQARKSSIWAILTCALRPINPFKNLVLKRHHRSIIAIFGAVWRFPRAERTRESKTEHLRGPVRARPDVLSGHTETAQGLR